jgi:2,5-diketo-D-gluconate reductase A
VGDGIKRSEVARDQLFITSKLRSGAHDRDTARKSFDATMTALGLETLDMFLIHWPVPGQDKYVEAWKALIELRQEGRIRTIGVSNFNRDHIERIVKETGETPAVNQIELHPYFQQRDKRDFLHQQGILIECYSPLGSGAVLKDGTIAAIGKAHGKSVAQTIIRWHLQQGLIVIPKTTHKERMQENLDVFDFELSADEMRQIDGLDQGEAGRTGSNPATNNDVF